MASRKGRPVTRNELSHSSRKFFQETLAGQGHNEMLSTPNWCGRDYPVQGIPQQVPSRWIKPDGTVTSATRSTTATCAPATTPPR